MKIKNKNAARPLSRWRVTLKNKNKKIKMHIHRVKNQNKKIKMHIHRRHTPQSTVNDESRWGGRDGGGGSGHALGGGGSRSGGEWWTGAYRGCGTRRYRDGSGGGRRRGACVWGTLFVSLAVKQACGSLFFLSWLLCLCFWFFLAFSRLAGKQAGKKKRERKSLLSFQKRKSMLSAAAKQAWCRRRQKKIWTNKTRTSDEAYLYASSGQVSQPKHTSMLRPNK